MRDLLIRAALDIMRLETELANSKAENLVLQRKLGNTRGAILAANSPLDMRRFVRLKLPSSPRN